jgi:putative hydrolase of the HAD superfamily
MKIRAVIFDIYNTLLEIRPPPPDAEARWTKLCRAVFGAGPRLDLAGFGAACQAVIAREHGEARQTGIAYPEIFWPAVACEGLPELARLKPKQLWIFLAEHAALQRRVRLMPGAAAVLRGLSRDKLLLGLASNSQPYTLTELDAALASARLRFKIFKPELNFFSFEAGFSKPDPHVFRWLAARLRNSGITTRETLIVGDRLDNDLEPARAQGFQTWHLTVASSVWPTAGGWASLAKHLTRGR